jgi:hypothetical protein
MTSFRLLGLGLSTAVLLASVSACVAPGLVVTPQSLPGCWEGSAFANVANAKVEITATEEENVFRVDGSATGAGQSLPLNNIKVKLEGNELKPQGLGQVVPLKLKLEGDKIVASSDQLPFSMDLKRCN